MKLTEQQRTALKLSLQLHSLVKDIANENTGKDQSLIDEIEYRGLKLHIHYEARSDQCHRGITISLSQEEQIDLALECKGWIYMRKNNEHIYTQRPRDDIKDKFEGDIDQFIEVANRILYMFLAN